MAKSEYERADDKRVMQLFRGRCIVCMRPATEINEIVLRARTRNAIVMKQNRVPMCHSCHHIYHWSGVTDEKMDKLREFAIRRLDMLGEPLEKW